MLGGLLMVLLSTSCLLVNSPPFWEKQVRERLRVEAFEEAQKQLLVENEECEIGFLRKYASSELVAARVLIASNPGVDDELSRALSKDQNLYVRGAVAASGHTPRYVLLELLSDKDTRVRSYLASNGNLTQHEILALHWWFEDPPLTAFAMNPNLPDEIRERILRSDNQNAKRWLEITDERRRHESRI